ncbi:hypothetical protein QZH41_007127 [Actinostola sp. cb2023]|nr:hypothetical protein QZH41_007127 [Actinostola sp. cb2023]
MVSNSTGDWTLSSVVVMGCWLSIIIFIGVFGNILVIIVSVQGTRVRSRGKDLIVSMACADMMESLNMIFVLITAVSYGEWIFGDVICTLHGFMTNQFVIASMYSLMVISVNRYFMVVKSNHYKKVFSDRNLTDDDNFYLDFPISFCSSTSSRMVQIFVQVRQHKTRVQAIGTSSNINVEEIRITKTLIIIIVAYLVCFIPPAVANLIEMGLPNYRIPFWVDVISMNLIFTNHANNPVIYGFFNRQYRQAFKELFF